MFGLNSDVSYDKYFLGKTDYFYLSTLTTLRMEKNDKNSLRFHFLAKNNFKHPSHIQGKLRKCPIAINICKTLLTVSINMDLMI